MSFEELQAKVARAEVTLEAQERRVAANLRVLGGCWREAWTPPRVIVAGLAAGFLAGWARPARAVAGIEPARWLQLAGSLAGLVGTVQAAFAASDAKDAAEEAGDAAAGAAGTAAPESPPAKPTPGAGAGPTPPATERRRAPDPSWDTPPRPAEAATELSEPR
ncbi:protein sip-5 [Luteimonas terricola]|uniref:Protein sip-5 n=1 Tax=Luteimonas terricola TaxID=645597 RepID=A0ABQ2EB13_9GAMM|nr:protein sip-5 [Luteimonas terricola]GGJ98098.1 hypothetical protein GCM10011394_03770 [Luteimonas terricola]